MLAASQRDCSTNSASLSMLRLRLRRAIFPVRYNDRFYADVQASGEYTQLGAHPLPSESERIRQRTVGGTPISFFFLCTAYYSTDILIGAICCRLEPRPEGGNKYDPCPQTAGGCSLPVQIETYSIVEYCISCVLVSVLFEFASLEPLGAAGSMDGY